LVELDVKYMESCRLWLNLLILRSRISNFNEGIFRYIILHQNIISGSFNSQNNNYIT